MYNDVAEMEIEKMKYQLNEDGADNYSIKTNACDMESAKDEKKGCKSTRMEGKSKKKKGTNTSQYMNYTGYSRVCPSLGVMYEKEEQERDAIKLPDIGDIVEIYNIGYYSRAVSGKNGNTVVKKRTYYEPAAGCLAARGEVMKFRVIGYTHGMDKKSALSMNNKMILECVFPDYSARLKVPKSFPTRFIACGHCVAVVVQNVNEITEEYSSFCNEGVPAILNYN